MQTSLALHWTPRREIKLRVNLPTGVLRSRLLVMLTTSLGNLRGQSFQAIYAFGSEMTATQGGPYAQGRWCNGPVQAEHIGLEVTIMDFFKSFDVIYERASQFGFTVTDIAAWHDDDLPDKSYGGPGSRYLFWDNVHPSSAYHALMAHSMEAALNVPALRIAPDATAPIIWAQNLGLGDDYAMEHSDDLRIWVDLGSFKAVDFTHAADWPLCNSSACFFRLRIPF